MELGFIQTAAPASSPAPLVDTSTSSDAFEREGGAFDAALAKTLDAVNANAGGKGVPARGAQAATREWTLTSLFVSSTFTTPPAAGEAAASTEDGAGATEAPAPSDGTDDSPAAADLVVPVPVAAAVPTPPNTIALPGQAVPGQIDPNAASTSASGTAQPTKTAEQAVSSSAWPPSANASDAAFTQVPTATAGTNGTADPATMTADKPVASETPSSKGSALDASRTQAGQQVRAARPEFVDQTQQAAQGANAAQSQAVPAATTGSMDAVVPQLTSKIADSQPAEPGNASAGLQGDAAAETLANNQAAMSGEDQSGAQPKPSQEFMRFATALAQVTASADEPRAATSVVAPMTAGAAQAQTTAVAPAASAVPAGTVETPETHGAENVGRLVQAMRVIARPGAWEATVRLNPEHLGDVSIALRVERNTVSAVVNAESANVRQWLESQEQSVRSGMAEHGLELDRFIVQRDGQRREGESQQQESPRRQRRQPQVTTQRFEIVV